MTIPTGYGGRDSPDFSVGDVGRGLSVNIDGSELASRLGALQTFSRTGSLLYQDSFDYGLGSWDIVKTGGDSSVKLFTTSSFRSPYCVRMFLDNTETSRVSMSKSFGYPYMTTIGVELTFRIGKEMTILSLNGTACDSVRKQDFGIRIDNYGGYFFFKRYDGVWVTPYATNIDLNDVKHFHTIKLVVDLSAQVYKSVTIDDLSYAPNPSGLQITAGGDYSYIDFVVDYWLSDYDTNWIFIDDFIFTINEPA